MKMKMNGHLRHKCSDYKDCPDEEHDRTVVHKIKRPQLETRSISRNENSNIVLMRYELLQSQQLGCIKIMADAIADWY